MTDLYRLYAADGSLLYVGISLSIAQRIASHRCSQPWWDEVARIDVEKIAGPRAAAIEVETRAIRAERPRHNIAGVPRAQTATSARATFSDGGYVSASSAAELLGVSVRTIHRWVRKGLITPRVKFPGSTGAFVFERADVLAFGRLMAGAA